jgi:two-component sensor histidine kinase
MGDTVGSRSYPIRLHLAIYGMLIVCPLLVVGVLVSNLYVSKERRALQGGAHAIVRDATAAIDRELDRYQMALRVLSASENLVQGNLRRFYLQAKAFTETVPGSNVVLRHLDGHAIFATSLPWGAAPAKFRDDALRSADRRAIESRTAVVSDLLIGSTSSDAVIAVEQPVVADGEVAYLLTMAISPVGIRNILLSHLEGSGWLLRVTDNNELNIARSWDGERFAGPDGDRSVGTRPAVGFIEKARDSAGSFISTTIDGIPVFNAYLRSSLSGWRVSAGIPISDLEAPLYRSILVLTIIAGVGLVSSLLLAIFYGQFLARPVQALHGLALSTGRGSVDVMRTGVTELDGVAASLARFIMLLKDRDRVQSMLVNELNHRVRNTLAVIQALATQTRRRSNSLDDFGVAFEGRLMAMARSHSVLSRTKWRGGDLEEIVSESCKPFCEKHRLSVEGPRVALPPRAVVGMSMVIHELATNSVKYGAFSDPSGNVQVRWDVHDRELRFAWKEQNGAPIQPSQRKGFGSVLISSIIEADLDGKVEMTLESDGLRCAATIPIKGVAAGASCALTVGAAGCAGDKSKSAS